MALTKVSKPLAQYQSFIGPADMSAGDILDIRTSLGRNATTITIESVGGESVLRFNVGKKIYRNQESVGNKAYLGADAAFYDSAVLVDEIEEERPDVIIEQGSSHTWKDEIPVGDIKIVTMAPILRITVT